MKKILHSCESKNSSRKLLGSTPLEHALPAPDAGLLRRRVAPGVRLTLAEWKREALRLDALESHYNPWRGVPGGWRFDLLYGQGYSPEDALVLWRDWEPWEDA